MTLNWIGAFKSFLTQTSSRTVLMGVGNPVRRDDSVGIYIAGRIRSQLGSNPSPRLKIMAPVDHPEVRISKVDLTRSSLLLFDAVEAGLTPASIIFANLADTRFGFFATHNIPLRMLPSVRENPERVFVLGVQPQDLSVGEGLSDAVMPAAEEVVRVAIGCMGGA